MASVTRDARDIDTLFTLANPDVGCDREDEGHGPRHLQPTSAGSAVPGLPKPRRALPV